MAPGKRRRREHRPHFLGPRIYERGRWLCADLRPWGGKRVTLRDPDAPGWPDRGPFTDDPKRAREWAERYVDHLQGREGKQRVRTIEQVGRDLRRHRERQQRAATTINEGVRAARALSSFLGPPTPITGVGPRDIQRFFDHMLDLGYAPAGLDTMRRHLSALFSFAEVSPNPASRKRVQIPEPSTEARDWSNEELARIRNAADNLGLRLYVELALGTGCRVAEIIALEGRDFSEASRVVKVRRQVSRDGRVVDRLKGKRSRVAVVLPVLWDHLPDEKGLLVAEGGHITPRRARDIMVEVLENAGLYSVGVGWHRFRHTYARLFLEEGGWLDELQASLGHGSIRTTERVYGHFAPERAAGFAVSRIYGKGRHLRAV